QKRKGLARPPADCARPPDAFSRLISQLQSSQLAGVHTHTSTIMRSGRRRHHFDAPAGCCTHPSSPIVLRHRWPPASIRSSCLPVTMTVDPFLDPRFTIEELDAELPEEFVVISASLGDVDSASLDELEDRNEALEEELS